MRLPFLESPLPHSNLQSHEWDKIVTVSRLDENTIYKPRPLYWEWLFLCPDSFLRRRLHRVFLEACDYSPFEQMAELEFFDMDNLTTAGRVGRGAKRAAELRSTR